MKPTPEQVARLIAPPLTKEDLILRLENAQRALSVAHKALGDITLDALDMYDLEALRDIHLSSGMMSEELGTLLDRLHGKPDTDPDPFAGVGTPTSPTQTQGEPFADLLDNV